MTSEAKTLTSYVLLWSADIKFFFKFVTFPSDKFDIFDSVEFNSGPTVATAQMQGNVHMHSERMREVYRMCAHENVWITHEMCPCKCKLSQ